MNKYNRIVLLSLLLVSWSVGEAQTAIDLEIRAFDLIELNNGNQFEGKILVELTDLIKFETSAGKVSFKMSEVKSIRYRNPPEKVYQARRMGDFDSTSSESQFEIGQWCLDPGVGLLEQGVSHLEESVRLNPATPAPYLLLFPIYQQTQLRQFNTRDQEMTAAGMMVETLLRGVQAGIELEGLVELAVTQLIQVGEHEAAVILLTQISEGEMADPRVATALKKLVVLLDSLGRTDESREAANRLREGGGGSDVEVLQREIR